MSPKHADEAIVQHKGCEAKALLTSLTNYPSLISQQIAKFTTHEIIAYHFTANGNRLVLKDKEDGKVYEVLVIPMESSHE